MLGGLRGKLERVHEAALRQLDLEAVLALRFCAAQRCIGCFSEGGFGRGLIG
jgi:hypothetical protein